MTGFEVDKHSMFILHQIMLLLKRHHLHCSLKEQFVPPKPPGKKDIIVTVYYIHEHLITFETDKSMQGHKGLGKLHNCYSESRAQNSHINPRDFIGFANKN